MVEVHGMFYKRLNSPEIVERRTNTWKITSVGKMESICQ